jgi:toxin ParE1/3/4
MKTVRPKVVWSQRAIDDLLEIGRYIARDDAKAARRWVEKLRQSARDAALEPHSGRRVPEINREEIREVILRSYRIVYREAANGIEVLTVFEGHRLLSERVFEEDEKT